MASEQSIVIENAELLTARELRRELAPKMKLLESGELEKLVVTVHGRMVAVVLPLDRYVGLVKDE